MNENTPPGVFRIWQNESSADWQDRVAAVAEALWVHCHGQRWPALKELVSHLLAQDEEMAARLTGETRELVVNALDFGAVLGFALAKTWPDSLEDLDRWGERALAYMGWQTGEDTSK